jgi:hypothetical protein
VRSSLSADDVRLSADDVRRRLAEALEPVRVEAEAALVRVGRDVASRLRYVVQLHPLLVQITMAPDEGKPAKTIVSFGGHRLPDRGAALGAAAEEFTAGILSALPEKAAEAVMVNAAVAAGGGLVVVFDPTDEAAILIVVEPGRSLGEGTYVGGISDAPETTH